MSRTVRELRELFIHASQGLFQQPCDICCCDVARRVYLKMGVYVFVIISFVSFIFQPFLLSAANGRHPLPPLPLSL